MGAAENPVRGLHNAVARSGNDVVSSTRPASTTAAELRRMVSDVIHKLALEPGMRVLEIGCGTGVLALPLARVSGQFVGIDFAEDALNVLEERLDRERLQGTTQLVCLDVLACPPEVLDALGEFDRVLVYATFHYIATDDEGREFLRRAIGRLRPGGMAVIGNLPVDELEADGLALHVGSRPTQVWRVMRWLLRDGTPVPRGITWKVRSLGYRMASRVRRGSERGMAGGGPNLPVGTTTQLSLAKIESWLADIPGISHSWLAPEIGVPLFSARADLLIRRLV